MLTTACCLVVELGVRSGLDSVSGWLAVMNTNEHEYTTNLYYFLLSLSLSRCMKYTVYTFVMSSWEGIRVARQQGSLINVYMHMNTTKACKELFNIGQISVWCAENCNKTGFNYLAPLFCFFSTELWCKWHCLQKECCYLISLLIYNMNIVRQYVEWRKCLNPSFAENAYPWQLLH